jgi:rubrerythrin
MDWVTFLEVMIEDEKAAINKYQLAIEKADSKKLKTVLEQLMGEEEVHIGLLEHEIKRLQAKI